jgi:hypothetical protein
MMQEFDFELHHRSGKDNIVADYLSRPILLVGGVCARTDEYTFKDLDLVLSS